MNGFEIMLGCCMFCYSFTRLHGYPASWVALTLRNLVSSESVKWQEEEFLSFTYSHWKFQLNYDIASKKKEMKCRMHSLQLQSNLSFGSPPLVLSMFVQLTHRWINTSRKCVRKINTLKIKLICRLGVGVKSIYHKLWRLLSLFPFWDEKLVSFWEKYQLVIVWLVQRRRPRNTRVSWLVALQ